MAPGEWDSAIIGGDKCELLTLGQMYSNTSVTGWVMHENKKVVSKKSCE